VLLLVCNQLKNVSCLILYNKVISAGSHRVFKDCGILGKQVINVEGSNQAIVVFRTGQASLTQRGFLLYFEGSFKNRLLFEFQLLYKL